MSINMFELKVKYPHREININCAGSSFRPKETFTHGISIGDRVEFVLDPTNPYREVDANGETVPNGIPVKIMATNANGEVFHLGFIKSDWLESYHTCVDKYDVQFHGTVSDVFGGSDDGRKNWGARVSLAL